MSRKDDVMIADGIGEEIGRLALVGETYQLLGAAEVGLRLEMSQSEGLPMMPSLTPSSCRRASSTFASSSEVSV